MERNFRGEQVKEVQESLDKSLIEWKFKRGEPSMAEVNKAINKAADLGFSLILKTKSDFTSGVTSVRNTLRYASVEGHVWTFSVPAEGSKTPTKYNGKLYLEADTYMGNQMLALREAFDRAGSTGVALFFPEEIISLEVNP